MTDEFRWVPLQPQFDYSFRDLLRIKEKIMSAHFLGPCVCTNPDRGLFDECPSHDIGFEAAAPDA